MIYSVMQRRTTYRSSYKTPVLRYSCHRSRLLLDRSTKWSHCMIFWRILSYDLTASKILWRWWWNDLMTMKSSESVVLRFGYKQGNLWELYRPLPVLAMYLIYVLISSPGWHAYDRTRLSTRALAHVVRACAYMAFLCNFFRKGVAGFVFQLTVRYSTNCSSIDIFMCTYIHKLIYCYEYYIYWFKEFV